MAEMNGNAKRGPGYKRGILFTMSVLLLSISLVSLAILLSENSAKSKRGAVAVLDIDRVSGAYANIESQLVRILSHSSNITVRGNYAIFNESLPFSSQVETDVDRFVQFESDFADLNVSIDASNLKVGSFMIQPNNITVTHPGNEFRITPQDAPGSAEKVTSYDVNITYPAESADN